MSLIKFISDLHKREKIIPTFENLKTPRSLITSNCTEINVNTGDFYTFDTFNLPFTIKMQIKTMGIYVVSNTYGSIFGENPLVYIRVFNQTLGIEEISSISSFESLNLTINGDMLLRFDIVNNSGITLPLVGFISYYLESF